MDETFTGARRPRRIVGHPAQTLGVVGRRGLGFGPSVRWNDGFNLKCLVARCRKERHDSNKSLSLTRTILLGQILGNSNAVKTSGFVRGLTKVHFVIVDEFRFRPQGKCYHKTRYGIAAHPPCESNSTALGQTALSFWPWGA